MQDQPLYNMIALLREEVEKLNNKLYGEYYERRKLERRIQLLEIRNSELEEKVNSLGKSQSVIMTNDIQRKRSIRIEDMDVISDGIYEE